MYFMVTTALVENSGITREILEVKQRDKRDVDYKRLHDLNVVYNGIVHSLLLNYNVNTKYK